MIKIATSEILSHAVSQPLNFVSFVAAKDQSDNARRFETRRSTIMISKSDVHICPYFSRTYKWLASVDQPEVVLSKPRSDQTSLYTMYKVSWHQKERRCRALGPYSGARYRSFIAKVRLDQTFQQHTITPIVTILK